MVEHLDADIISLCETHLEGNTEVQIEGYETFVHNRQSRNRNLNRTFGGIQVLIRRSRLNEYDVKILDKSLDGIHVLCLHFESKVSDFCFIVISCYLPPSNSVWGRDGTSFYCHLRSLVYLYADVDAMYIMGDLNSRFGDNQEHIEGIDLKVPSRKVLDVGKNKHGDLLIDFLKDGELCIVNGRVNPENDNFTFVDPGRGSSVVDFLIVPYCNMKSITDFHVHLARELMTNCNVDGCTLTDHSLLEFTINPHYSIQQQAHMDEYDESDDNNLDYEGSH